MPIYLRLRTYPCGRPAFVLPQTVHPPFTWDGQATVLHPWGQHRPLRVTMRPDQLAELWRQAIDAHMREKYTDYTPDKP